MFKLADPMIEHTAFDISYQRQFRVCSEMSISLEKRIFF
jgi:hypothetical protein